MNGFCTDCFKLCDLIPPNEVYDSNKAQIDLSELVIKDLDNILGYSYFNNNDKPDKKTIKLLLDKKRCLSCKNTILSERIDILERLISTLLGIPDIEPNQLLYSLKVKYDNDIDLFYKDIMKKIMKKLMC